MAHEHVMPTLFGRGTAVFKQHADLRPLVSRLRQQATDLVLGKPHDEAEVEGALAEFFNQLLAHFAAEEDEGYFGTLIDDHPGLSIRVEHLMGEHEEMVDAIERLKMLGQRGGCARDLGLGLTTLLDRFEKHERDENALMRTFLTLDPEGSSAVPKPER
jgi:hemerythrin